MTVWHLRDQALTFGATTMQSRHVGLRPGFVDEDQPAGADLVLVLLPLSPPPRHIGAILLAGVRAFFKAEANVVNEMPDTVVTDLNAALVQFRQQFAAGDIRLLFNPCPYPCLFAGEREGLFAAHWQRRRTARFGLASGPADRRGVAHLVMRRCPLPAHAGGDGRDNAFAEIERIRSCHAGWPPVQPAS